MICYIICWMGQNCSLQIGYLWVHHLVICQNVCWIWVMVLLYIVVTQLI